LLRAAPCTSRSSTSLRFSGPKTRRTMVLMRLCKDSEDVTSRTADLEGPVVLLEHVAVELRVKGYDHVFAYQVGLENRTIPGNRSKACT
jgi:hypothetical protein